MWLLNAETRLLEEFLDDRAMAGTYAILSHTWATDEVSFADVETPAGRAKAGYRKIERACTQALEDGLRYVWVDTACIDKKSSAELSEAINSMYRWYYHARICYVYLTDYVAEREDGDRRQFVDRLRGCRWWRRGWTLQELLSPCDVRFFDAGWNQFMEKSSHVYEISVITGIDEDILADRDRLHEASIATRMSMAANRMTTRPEDQAYCLLGIFDVHMPLLYGEGKAAFKRLQEEVVRTWRVVDHSILTWSGESDGLLADSPALFRGWENVAAWSHLHNETFELTSKGLKITVYTLPDDTSTRTRSGSLHKGRSIMVALDCSLFTTDEAVAMIVRERPVLDRDVDMKSKSRPPANPEVVVYDRVSELFNIPFSLLHHSSKTTLTLARLPFRSKDVSDVLSFWRTFQYTARAYQPEFHNTWPIDVQAMEELQERHGTSPLLTHHCWSLWPARAGSDSTSGRYHVEIFTRTGQVRYGMLAGSPTNQDKPRLYISVTPNDDSPNPKTSSSVHRSLRQIRHGETVLLDMPDAHFPLQAHAKLTFSKGKVVWALTVSNSPAWPILEGH